MTREEAMQSFVTSYTVTGSRIGHKSARTPTDHAVLPEHAEAACGAKVLVIRAGADAPPFDSERPFTCTNCKRTLKQFPPPLDAVEASHAANDRRWKNAHHANAVGATRAPIRARIVAAPQYGRPALALKVEGGDLSVQLIAAGFRDGDVVEIAAAADLQELRDQSTRHVEQWNAVTPLVSAARAWVAADEKVRGKALPHSAHLHDAARNAVRALYAAAREYVAAPDKQTIPQPSTAACYLAAHDDGRPDPHGEADPARAE